MLKQRLITALWGIPLLLVAIWFANPLPWFTVVIALWGVFAAYEFFSIVSNRGKEPLVWLGLFLTLFFVVSRNTSFLFLVEPYMDLKLFLLLPLSLAIVLPLVWLVFRRGQTGIGERWTWTVVPVFYIGWMLSHLVVLREVIYGRNWVLFVFVVIFASDSAAYFIGRAFGKHKMAPKISPGKTWEGAAGGLLGAAVFGLLFSFNTFFGLPLSWWQAVFLGLLVSVFGQAGDLVESYFKRRMGVKDSGRYVPGHGGFLDRLDSILFGGIVVYYFVLLASS